MKKRIENKFLAFLHCTIEGLPLLMVLFYAITMFFNGFTASGSSMSVNYSSNFYLEDAFTYFNANSVQIFTIVDVDFLDLMGITSTNAYLDFVNWYLNYLVNIELVLFLPEILLIVIHGFKKLVACWTNKIGESY